MSAALRSWAVEGIGENSHMTTLILILEAQLAVVSRGLSLFR